VNIASTFICLCFCSIVLLQQSHTCFLALNLDFDALGDDLVFDDDGSLVGAQYRDIAADDDFAAAWDDDTDDNWDDGT